MATRVWIGGSGTWDSLNAANWDGGNIPAAGDDVVFPIIPDQPDYTVTLGADTPALASVTLTDNAGVTLAVGAFQLSDNGNSGGTELVSIGAGNTMTMTTGGKVTAGGLTVNGTLSGAGTITIQTVGSTA